MIKKTLAPGINYIDGSSCVLPRPYFMHETELLDEVAAAYRYRRSIRLAVRKDLMIWAAAHNVNVRIEVFESKPYVSYPAAMVEDWLDHGGLAFIINELEGRSSRRVVAFPDGRGRS
jgi:hypothetical protein